jgi:hypothetical protein
MFIGTEFGVFFTVDGGNQWTELDGGIPTISTRDVKIQRRENDLVIGTFGRGIYILDDYAPLRALTEKSMEQDALLFAPSRPVKWFQLDRNHSRTDGDDAFIAKNPEHGATLTYFLKDSLLTAKEVRQQAEKKQVKEKNYPKYPSWETIEAENQEAKPAVYIEIKDADGQFVNRIAGKTKKGLHRITWDMTYASARALTESGVGNGLTAMPGQYTATLYKRVGSEVSQLATPVEFELKSIYQQALAGPSAEKAKAFAQDIVAAQKLSSMTTAMLGQITESMKTIRTAVNRTPGNIASLEAEYASIQAEINAINLELNGLQSRVRKGATPATINSRLGYAMSAMRSSYGPTQQHLDQLSYATEGLDAVSKRVKTLHQTTLPALQKAVVEAGGPWTLGTIAAN